MNTGREFSACDMYIASAAAVAHVHLRQLNHLRAPDRKP
jgi:hypothetical protein